MSKTIDYLLQKIDHFVTLAQATLSPEEINRKRLEMAEERKAKKRESNRLKREQILSDPELLEKYKAESATKHRQIALERAKRKSTVEPDPIYTKQQRLSGRTKRNQYDFEVIKLDGLVLHLTQRLASQRSSLKQKISTQLEKARKDPNILKPYLDDIAVATNSGNRSDLLQAVKNLREREEEFQKAQPEIIAYLANVRAAKFFYKFRDDVKKISTFIESTPLSSHQTQLIDYAINEGIQLISYYKNLQIKRIDQENPLVTNYGAPIEIIERIILLLRQTRQM